MKKIIRLALVAAALQLTAFTTYSQVSASDPYQSYQDDDTNPATDPSDIPYQRDVTYQDFYDNLSSYGQWINYPGYGQVWQPSVGSDFRPYATNGHWVYTDMGWSWASGYNWGWAAFHYGRWFYDPNDGWLWVPGYDWAPAWVSWRSSGDYYGWAPLMPGFGFGVSVGAYYPPVNYWCFVPHAYVASPYIGNYYINRSLNVSIINRTSVIRNTYNYNGLRARTYFASGPAASEVARYTHADIRPVSFRNTGAVGSMHFFRPAAIHPASQRFNRGAAQTYRNTASVNNQSINNNRSFFNHDGFQRQTQHRGDAAISANRGAAFQGPQRATMPLHQPNANTYRQPQMVRRSAPQRTMSMGNRSFARAAAPRSAQPRNFSRR